MVIYYIFREKMINYVIVEHFLAWYQWVEFHNRFCHNIHYNWNILIYIILLKLGKH